MFRKITLILFASLFIVVVVLLTMSIFRDKVSDPQEREWLWKTVYKADELDLSRFQSGPGETILVFTGDIMPWDYMKRKLEKYGMNYTFEGTAPILQNADFTIGNLECPIAVDATPRKLTYPYQVPPKTLAGLKWAGFDLVSLANNHIKDCGNQGVIETLHFLEKADIPFFGAGKNLKSAKEPYIVNVNGVRIAFVTAVSPEVRFKTYKDSIPPGAFENRYESSKRKLLAGRKIPGTVLATVRDVRRAIKNVRDKADIVVFYPHWGIRYHRPVYEKQEQLAHAAIDAGADLIIGHHAHFWQPVENYKGKPIIYGLGNFAFGSLRAKADEGLICRVVIKEKKIHRIELIPIYTNNISPKVWSQAKVISGKYAQEMLGRIAELSARRDALLRIDNGIGVLDVAYW